MPAAAPDSGSNAFVPSTSAQTSSCRIRVERIVNARLVLPEEGAPKISTIAPRGRPPMDASSVGIPEGIHSHTRVSTSVKGDEARSPRAVSNWARSNAARIEIPAAAVVLNGKIPGLEGNSFVCSYLDVRSEQPLYIAAETPHANPSSRELGHSRPLHDRGFLYRPNTCTVSSRTPISDS